MTETKADGPGQNTPQLASYSPSSSTANDSRAYPLDNKVALIAGLASEGSCNLAVVLAEKGSDIVIVYCSGADEAAREVQARVEALNRRCIAILKSSSSYFSQEVIDRVLATFGRLDIFISYPTPLALNEKPFAANGASDKAGYEKTSVYSYRSLLFPHFSLMKAALKEIVTDQ